MQSNLLPSGMKALSFDGAIWNLLVSEPSQLVIDARDETNQISRLQELDIHTLSAQSLNVELSWWEKIIGMEGGDIYSIKYLDQNDPSKSIFQQINRTSGNRVKIDELPTFTSAIDEPQLYEQGSEHHQTVSRFLALEMPLSCEYLEWQDKIIISYYLRSEKGFDRYLLLLNDGNKVWRLKQDTQMKGFASGAFLVWNGQLIFIRERNEVCIHTL